MPLSRRYISLGDVYIAYRKAKVEAFYENTHVQALAFTAYEQDLQKNLVRLHRTLLDDEASWSTDLPFIGDYAYLPKSIDSSGWDDRNSAHFRAIDPFVDWTQRFEESQSRASANLRLIIKPTVDFQIVSALWILKVGQLFDAKLNPSNSFGNRLRRLNRGSDHAEKISGINLASTGLFTPYFSAYREWRENGLSAIEKALLGEKDVLAITMDVERFYHRVSPKFLLRRRFLTTLGVTLSKLDLLFTKHFLAAIDTWYKTTPDYADRPEGAIPVGLSASKVIANVLLADFDRTLARELRPLYYGRYVDDLFLVLENLDSLQSAKQVTRWLASHLPASLSVQRNSGGAPSLRLTLPYAEDSDLILAGAKQKIFALSSAHGLDLIQHIRNQIRIQSSEYRLLPAVPESGAEMASRALLATPDAKLEVDALRKADVVSVRRLGLSLLLRDIETYSSDLQPRSWGKVRNEFYGLVRRHALTPSGFFEFSGFLPRVFGLMLACRDFDTAEQFIADSAKVVAMLERTSTLGLPNQRERFRLCVRQYAEALRQTGMQAATERTIEVNKRFLDVLRKLSTLAPEIEIPTSVARLKTLVHQILLSDWGRRPYKDFWYLNQGSDESGPPVPKQLEIRKILRLGGIRRFLRHCPEMKMAHWPALAFPTRPMRPDEISLVAPDVLLDPAIFRRLILVLRGARVPRLSEPGAATFTLLENGVNEFVVAGPKSDAVTIAITSYETTEKQWELAAIARQDRSWGRYTRLNWLVNRILQERVRPNYIVFPELSIPLKWALRVARKLAMNKVSLLAGVEYHRDRLTNYLRNDCLVSLVTNWPGYASHIVRLQPKFSPAHTEKKALARLQHRLHCPTGALSNPTVYVHRGFCFSVLICSDLTNIVHRQKLRGKIDALFILEWNRDVNTFSSLVEATSVDLHLFVTQVNNRLYGDSRVRCPSVADYLRDVVQVKGGDSDFYVIGTINHLALRKEQRGNVNHPQFKPLPIGFKMSDRRRFGK